MAHVSTHNIKEFKFIGSTCFCEPHTVKKTHYPQLYRVTMQLERTEILVCMSIQRCNASISIAKC